MQIEKLLLATNNPALNANVTIVTVANDPSCCTTDVNTKCVLVTGATGFIGTHTVLELLNAGYRVIAVGNSTSDFNMNNGVLLLPKCLIHVLVLARCAGSMLEFCRCNLQDVDGVEQLFKTKKFDTVIHLASSKGVAPSIASPIEFYKNNLFGSLNLIQMCNKYGRKKFVFMSSATVYGVPKEIPVMESSETGGNITNPYGWAKFIVEQMLRDVCRTSEEWRVIILRSFDPAGAHPSGLIGEDVIHGNGPRHLLPLIASVALGKVPAVRICGNTFPTRDGTGSRDFVHVVDVARAIVHSVARIEQEEQSVKMDLKSQIQMEKARTNNCEVYNLGMGCAHTVLEMVKNYENACGKKINIVMGSPRPGDIAAICTDISAAKKMPAMDTGIQCGRHMRTFAQVVLYVPKWLCLSDLLEAL